MDPDMHLANYIITAHILKQLQIRRLREGK